MRDKITDKIKSLKWKINYYSKLFRYKFIEYNTYINYITNENYLIKKGNINTKLNNTIWSYWNGNIIPIDIQNFFNHNKSINPNYNYIVVNDDTLNKYLINFPNHINFPSIQHKADLIRLMLLDEHGGIWIDISTILTESLDWVNKKLTENKAEYLGFYNPNMMNDENNLPMIENWFMAARKDSIFIKSWLKEFLFVLETKSPRDYYLNQPYFNKIKQNIKPPFDRTFTMHLAGQKTMLELNNNFSYVLINAEDDGLFFNYASQDRAEYCSSLLIKKYKQLPKVIKITGGDRIKLEDFIRIRLYSKHSIYYTFNLLK